MRFPQSVSNIIKKMEAKHPSNIDSGVDEAARLIRKLPEFDEVLQVHFRHSIRCLIHEARTNSTQMAKGMRPNQENGTITSTRNGSGSVPLPRSSGLSDVTDFVTSLSFYDSWKIGGTTLGKITEAMARQLLPGLENTLGGVQDQVNMLKWALDNGLQGSKTMEDLIPEETVLANLDHIRFMHLGGSREFTNGRNGKAKSKRKKTTRLSA